MNRLYKVLPDLIHHDQSGFLKGRLIGDNLLDLISVMEHCSENNLESVILWLDFEKAFDTVNWDSLFEIFRFFNFGENYINMVSKLFENISSCTLNNGFSSHWFSPERGLHQGDCFSPPAFLLVVEILGFKISQNNNITGINLGHTHKKQAQFCR